MYSLSFQSRRSFLTIMSRLLRTFIPGNRYVTCDICGFDWRFNDMQRGINRQQKGLIVCPRCFDDVHPLDTPVKPPREKGPEPVR